MSNSTSLASELAQYEMGYEVYFHFEDVMVASTALLVYSHIITFDEEVHHIWKNPMRPGALLYFSMRYPALIARLMALLSPDVGSSTCSATGYAQASLWFIAATSSYAFQILRTSAVFPRIRILAWLLVFLSLPSVAYQIWNIAASSCTPTAASNDIVRVMATIQITTDLAFESLVLFATLLKTWRLVAEIKHFELGTSSLAETILRNGILHYAILVIADLGGLITTNIGVSVTTESASVGFGDASQPIRFILLSQFILDLRERAALPRITNTGRTADRTQETLRFVQEMVTQDFGEPLYQLPSAGDQQWAMAVVGTGEIE